MTYNRSNKGVLKPLLDLLLFQNDDGKRGERMPKQKIWRLCLFAALLISLTTVVYSGYQIVYSDNAIEESIKEWESLKTDALENTAVIAPIPEENQVEALKPEDAVNQGSAEKVNLFAKLIIESTKDQIPVVNGVALKDLNHGAGYYTKSVQPGQVGNCIILGHRETVFHNLGELKLQDAIVVEMLDKKYVYRVEETKIVDKINDDLLDPVKDATLTLITCYPIKYTGPVEKRYLVIAKLVDQ